MAAPTSSNGGGGNGDDGADINGGEVFVVDEPQLSLSVTPQSGDDEDDADYEGGVDQRAPGAREDAQPR